MPNPSTPAQYVLILLDMVESRGFNRGPLLAGTSLADGGIDGIGARVSEADFNNLVGNCLALTGDPSLGLQLGLRLNLSAHAMLGQAFMTCKDLGEVMDLFLKYYHLLAPNLHLGYEVIDDRCILAVIDTPEENRDAFYYELLFGAILNTLRGLLNREQLALEIEAPYPRPEHYTDYYEVFGEAVYFDCVQARIAFPAALLGTPLPSSNPALRALYEGECARLLADLEESDTVAERTLRLLRKLEGQYPQMPQLAQMLNFTPRTYRRRLEHERQSYQALLDQVRSEHATRYLQNTRLPIATIADLVGFNDASNFRRAYLKWTGRSPARVRRGH